MVGEESIGRNEVPSPEGGGGVTGILVSFYINTNYFRSLLPFMKVNKMADKAF